ncbi:hypothetical protein PYCCODRAFT_1431975 [Trametes coccinea BRFM310]|uniref:Secreted peptide n=1 Tax=Trametes coccinea (strain BRFM310) TaxID=1353009 RepID=A0A1Y2IYH0_TRAC3|nr:hypothetical protein PYCCODRAFT_1431975 [Trametes coccinea BRFM310]
MCSGASCSCLFLSPVCLVVPVAECDGGGAHSLRMCVIAPCFALLSLTLARSLLYSYGHVTTSNSPRFLSHLLLP